MRLFIHIGTEKTGSSFLQYSLAKNRSHLVESGIYYPNAGHRETDMLAGRISPGNAGELSDLLSQESWEEVSYWMKSKYNQATANKCNQLLLSNETLINIFSKKGVLLNFLSITDSLGFKCQDMLMIVREPVSQALSLYKHRSKSGNTLPLVDWLQKNYNLIKELGYFYDNIEQSNIGLSQHPYQKDSEYLVNTCLNVWLNLNIKINIEDQSVNPSLTLSELNLLRSIKKKDSYLANIFFCKMSNISILEKSNDVGMNIHAANQVSNFMSNYNYLWKRVHEKMSYESVLWEYTHKKYSDIYRDASFSQEQINAFSELMIYASSFSYLKKKVTYAIKKKVLFITPLYLVDMKNRYFK